MSEAFPLNKSRFECRIASWIELLPDPSLEATPGDKRKMPPTPSFSTASHPPARATSPSKRRRVDQSGSESEIPRPNDDTNAFEPLDSNEIPKPSETNRHSHVQDTLVAGSTPSISARSASGLGLSLRSRPSFPRPKPKRSPSPIKRTSQLRILDTPIEFVPPSGAPENQLPEDAHGLLAGVRRIAEYRLGFIPTTARDIITKKVPAAKSWPDHFFAPERPGDAELWTPDSDTDEVDADIPTLAAARHRKELAILRRIERAVGEAFSGGHAESAWNMKVHAPLLELAADARRGVALEPITAASIVREWLPAMAGIPPASLSALSTPVDAATDASSQATSTSTTTTGKMVDFAFVLALDDKLRRNNQRADYATLAAKVHDLVRTQPLGMRTINQSLYSPLIRRPIGVSIETKTSNDLEQGRIQLAIWASAWQTRMRAFCNGRRIVTLPLLLGGEHCWSLYFACDRVTSLEIVGPFDAGNTQSLVALYALLAVLRELVLWVDGPFKSWMMEVVDVKY